MDFKIFYTPSALADLEEVFTWSWEQHPARTERFARELLSHIELLRTFPRLGAPVSRFPGLRRLLHSRYTSTTGSWPSKIESIF